MSLAEVRRALAAPQAQLEGNAPVVPLDDCAYLQSNRIPKGLGLMFTKGHLVRIDVFEGGIGTVADSEERVKRLYSGHIVVKPHPYDPQGHYLIYLTAARGED